MDNRRALVILLLAMGWLTAATAASIAAAPTSLIDLPWVQMGVGCLISLWGGLARTAARVLSKGAEPVVLWKEVIKDVLASVLIGFIVYAVASWQNWEIWHLAVVLPLAGYGGARFLEPLSDAAVGRLAGALGGIKKEGP